MSMIGDGDSTIIKYPPGQVLTNNLITFSDKSGVMIRDLKIDWNSPFGSVAASTTAASGVGTYVLNFGPGNVPAFATTGVRLINVTTMISIPIGCLLLRFRYQKIVFCGPNLY